MQLSRKLLAFAFLAVLLFAALPSLSAAQDDDSVSSSSKDAADVDNEYEEEVVEEVDDEQQLYVMPAPDVQTYVKFLGIADNKFVAGEEVTALVGLHNAGQKTYNVSFVGAHLHSPLDQSFYVQNMTVRWTAALLPPQSEVTVEYRFRPDERLEPLDFLLSGWVIYNDTSATPVIYRSVFFNQTIELLEKRAEWTLQSALTYTLLAAGAAIVAYVVMQAQSGGAATKGKKSRVSAPAAAAAVNVSASPMAEDAIGAGSASSGWDVKVYRPGQQKAVGAKRVSKK